MFIRHLITSLIIVLLTNPTLQAAAPEIQGDVITDISLDSITNAAIADGASAQIIIGSFLEGKTFGDFRATVSAGVVTNAAAGSNSCAQIIIGSVAGNLPCSAPQ